MSDTYRNDTPDAVAPSFTTVPNGSLTDRLAAMDPAKLETVIQQVRNDVMDLKWKRETFLDDAEIKDVYPYLFAQLLKAEQSGWDIENPKDFRLLRSQIVIPDEFLDDTTLIKRAYSVAFGDEVSDGF